MPIYKENHKANISLQCDTHFYFGFNGEKFVELKTFMELIQF